MLYVLAPSAGSITCSRVTSSLVPLLSLTVMAAPSCAEVVPIRLLPLAVDASAVLAAEACPERVGVGLELATDGWEPHGCGCDGDGRGWLCAFAFMMAVGAVCGLVTGVVSDVQYLTGAATDPTANWYDPFKTNTSKSE